MKRISLFTLILFFATAGFAQKYDEVKNMILLGQTAKAKDLFDKNANEKFFSKPDGYLIKAALLGSLSLDSSKAAQADQNRNDAYEAFLKYKEMDPGMKLVDDPAYKNTPFNLYASYFNAGVQDINNKSYDNAYDKFKKTVDLSDVLIAKKIVQFPVDTNALYYAGILAETTKHPEEAIKYNTRLADINITGANYESVYQSLVRYYALHNDDANFEKYKALGKKLYPNSEFFNYNKLDFIVGGSNNFDEKIKNLQSVIDANPNDYKANMALAESIYDTLDSRREGAVVPANADELETKMITTLKKASGINSNELQPILLMGDHYITKSERIGDDMRTIETQVSKKGAKATAEEKQKLADAKAKYNAAYDLARENFEKAADMFSKKGTLDDVQKRQYRIIAGNLAQYYSYKREDAKGADLTKYIALEKKYNDLYDKLK